MIPQLGSLEVGLTNLRGMQTWTMVYVAKNQWESRLGLEDARALGILKLYSEGQHNHSGSNNVGAVSITERWWLLFPDRPYREEDFDTPSGMIARSIWLGHKLK